MKNNIKDEIELLKEFLNCKRNLNSLIKNFEMADNDLVDYYSYQIKATKSKMDYLLKLFKQKNIKLDMIENLEILSKEEKVI